jgi:hypothetical protein
VSAVSCMKHVSARPQVIVGMPAVTCCSPGVSFAGGLLLIAACGHGVSLMTETCYCCMPCHAQCVVEILVRSLIRGVGW